jgi:nucleotide-binding universal stress UspA family protein
VIGYDGSSAAQHAVREAGTLFPGRAALVLSVYKRGAGFELVELPTATVGVPAAPVDIRAAMEIEEAVRERAQRVAQQGADVARRAGLEADGLAIADELPVPVWETIVRTAADNDALAIVVGAHNRGRLAEALLGSTSRDVVRHATRPVVVVRELEEPGED